MEQQKSINVFVCNSRLLTEDRFYRIVFQVSKSSTKNVILLKWSTKLHQQVDAFFKTDDTVEAAIQKAMDHLETRFAFLIQKLSLDEYTEFISTCQLAMRNIQQTKYIDTLEYLFGPVLLEYCIKTSVALKLNVSDFQQESDYTYRLSTKGVYRFNYVLNQASLVFATKSMLGLFVHNQKLSFECRFKQIISQQLARETTCYQVDLGIPIMIEKYQFTRRLAERLRLFTILEAQQIDYQIDASSVDQLHLVVDPDVDVVKLEQQIYETVSAEIVKSGSISIQLGILIEDFSVIEHIIARSLVRKKLMYLGPTVKNWHQFRYHI